jgi:hypothetical protein
MYFHPKTKRGKFKLLVHKSFWCLGEQLVVSLILCTFLVAEVRCQRTNMHLSPCLQILGNHLIIIILGNHLNGWHLKKPSNMISVHDSLDMRTYLTLIKLIVVSNYSSNMFLDIISRFMIECSQS